MQLAIYRWIQPNDLTTFELGRLRPTLREVKGVAVYPIFVTTDTPRLL